MKTSIPSTGFIVLTKVVALIIALGLICSTVSCIIKPGDVYDCSKCDLVYSGKVEGITGGSSHSARIFITFEDGMMIEITHPHLLDDCGRIVKYIDLDQEVFLYKKEVDSVVYILSPIKLGYSLKVDDHSIYPRRSN